MNGEDNNRKTAECAYTRGRECEPQWGAKELDDATTSGVGEKMKKSSLVCCDGRAVLFLSPAFCAVDSSMLKNISVFVAMYLAGSCVDS